jgi:ABC-2 type transport system permease protein
MSAKRVLAVARRHAYVLLRSPHRWFDVLIWPLVDCLLFGSIGVFIARSGGTDASKGVAYLLAGILLFHVIYQSQIAVSTGFLEETWSRNILNLMTTPLREVEYASGVALFGLAKVAIGLGVVALAALGFYSFDILDVGWGLLPIGALLLVCGWSISLYVIGLVLRFGQSAEVLAWGILFVIMPLSGVFVPVSAMPPLLQPIARVLPTTHLFAAARTLLNGDPMPWGQLGWAVLGCAAAAVGGLAFVTHMLGVFRRRGFVTRFS